MIGISKALGCTVTAEGVETNEQLDALRALGCEHAQGFLFARPLDRDQLAAALGDAPASPVEPPPPAAARSHQERRRRRSDAPPSRRRPVAG
jgi:predicted signal transduction protein with EAL and GGDEF domain